MRSITKIKTASFPNSKITINTKGNNIINANATTNYRGSPATTPGCCHHPYCYICGPFPKQTVSNMKHFKESQNTGIIKSNAHAQAIN